MTIRKHKLWNAGLKVEVALVLLKGESLEEVSRLTGQPAHGFKGWQETFLQCGQATFHVSESAEGEGPGGQEDVAEGEGGVADHGQRSA